MKKFLKAGCIVVVCACAFLFVGWKNKKDDLNENKENPKSNTDEYDGTIPSVEAAESIEKSNDYLVWKGL